MDLKEILDIRNGLALKHRELYLSTINDLNVSCRELLQENLGAQLLETCKDDFLGQVVRRFFNTSDYYVTVDQLWKRISTFNYKEDYDPLKGNTNYSKEVFNYNDPTRMEKFKSATKRFIDEMSKEHNQKVYPEKRNGNEVFYGEDGNKYGSRTAYKTKVLNPGEKEMRDELTNEKVDKASIDGDHIMSRASASYNERYMKESFKEEREQFYDSKDNMQFINNSANRSKQELVDPDAIVEKWEKANERVKDNLKAKGYLDENGKVPEHVQKSLKEKHRYAANKESLFKLKHTDYKQVSKDSGTQVVKSVPSILAGQLLYYGLPPLWYECKRIQKNGVQSVDTFLEDLSISLKRTGNYIAGNIKNITSNVANSSLKKFVKTFFDILISIVQQSVRRIMSLIKDLALAIIDSIKILFDKNATSKQKAESIFNLFVLTITNTIVIVGLEYIEKQFPVVAPFMEAIEFLAVVVVSNLVMLIMQKADLFDIRYGLKVEKLKNIIDEYHMSYTLSTEELLKESNLESKSAFELIENEIEELSTAIDSMDLKQDSVYEELNRINQIFVMDIDFDKEWEIFLKNV
ncbi:hypothetical protein [Bacillus pacificus]|uniref:hypothetical protein n=1 Tax=Bacillus pacificus TaxID=2026187 RepID=UPI001E37E39F|nr:hypothetical protein [Bacillus pacificus]MCC2388676.1 hypothetical protein [Bacillus pacificus]HDR7253974.1 hypothetical protein [Bacillus pacificus]